jgi:fermentation-respiration switch protein FrsA (DUF1100 family)
VALPLGYACFVYCFLLLFLMAAEERLLYPAGGVYRGDPTFSHEDVWLQTSDGLKLHAWYCPIHEDRARPVVLFCHGNGGELSSRQLMAQRWQKIVGVNVLLFDYRGYGFSEGVPNEQGLYEDARTAYRWLREVKGYPPERILIAGRSLGGAVALKLATETSPPALVLESTFTSAADVAADLYPWFPVAHLMRDAYRSWSLIEQYEGPVFFSHGDADALIPVEHAERLFNRAKGPKDKVIFPDRDHNTFPPVDYYRRVKTFLERHCPHLATNRSADEC